MPTIDDAIRLAREFAASDSSRTGKQWRGVVEEFEHGWAIWTAPPEGELAPIGTGNKMVLDRETGRVSAWGSSPVETLVKVYAAARAENPMIGRPPTVYRKNIVMPQAPAGIGRLSGLITLTAPDGRLFWQRSALTDDIPQHHPLVAQWLAEQRQHSPGSLVRGAERHAILWVFSDALHELSPVELAASQLDSPLPCVSCATASVHFGVTDPAALLIFTPRPGDLKLGSGTLPDGSRFDPAAWAEIAFEMMEPIPRVEAARPIIERYPVATSQRRGPGSEVAIQPFHLGITEQLRDTRELVQEFGGALGASVFPLGRVDPHGFIAVDEHGRLFVLDEGGAWYCGRDIDTALRGLLEGLEMPRVRSDGSVSF